MAATRESVDTGTGTLDRETQATIVDGGKAPAGTVTVNPHTDGALSADVAYHRNPSAQVANGPEIRADCRK
ncbi:hypothetical protein GCM10010201_30090 [Pilimelia columellifera subsp. columellifera]|uniref:Uncharacterized protein n=1 Tax=Pilimelia columellifera subsp. columellifera TaxID=706583 RepID=A0ABN3NNP4_9ACTN